MFYEEKIINGVLCCRTRPEGEWEPCNAAHITFQLEFALARVKKLESALEDAAKIAMDGPLLPSAGECRYMSDECKAMALQIASRIRDLRDL